MLCGMSEDNDSLLLESDLPLVRSELPRMFKAVVRVLGALMPLLAIANVAKGLGAVSGPGLVAWLIVLGAMFMGVGMVVSTFLGDERWNYRPGTVVVKRRGWRGISEIQLSARNVRAAEVRWAPAEEDEHAWEVVLVPQRGFSELARRAGPRGVFSAGRFGTHAYAQRVSAALERHLGLLAG